MARAGHLLLVLTALLLGLALRLLRATWRVRVTGRPPSGSTLVAFWHGDQLALCCISVRPTVLVSRSRDGEIGASAARLLGFSVVRGSSSRGAVAGALGLIPALRQGGIAALAADGPRGPRHLAKNSTSRLAALADAAVVPVAAVASRSLCLSSWDRMAIPAPFATVRVVWGARLLPGASVQQALDLVSSAALGAPMGKGARRALSAERSE